MVNPKEQGGNYDSLAAEVPFDPPARERTAADHDEPWQYQPYHLNDQEKRDLLKIREKAIEQEFCTGIESIPQVDYKDPIFVQGMRARTDRLAVAHVYEVFNAAKLNVDENENPGNQAA